MSDQHKPTIEVFMRDVETHDVEILVENTADTSVRFRHVKFCRPDTTAYSFCLTTWPGYLSITGDMGSYTFSRLLDMFEFFRRPEINASYWAEKLVATSTSSGHRAFSEDFFREALTSDFERWTFADDAQKAAAWAKITDEWDGLWHHEGQEAIHMATDYKCPITGQRFDDFWDHNFEDYTYHFIWCLRAIRWGIEQYDTFPRGDRT